MWRRGRELGGLAAAVVAAACLSSCDGVRRWLFGSCPLDVEICEQACAEGVTGHEGCLAAAEHYQEKVRTEGSAPDRDKAIEYFARACEGGESRGCRAQAELRVPPLSRLCAVDSPSPEEPSPSTKELEIDPAMLDARVAPVRAGCDRRVQDNCLLLAALTVGQDEQLARSAFERACQAPGADASGGQPGVGFEPGKPLDLQSFCARADALVRDGERLRRGCEAGDPRDCGCLGELIWPLDPYRAIAIWRRERKERYGTPDGVWLRRRVAYERYANPPPGLPCNMWGQEAFDPKEFFDPCASPKVEPITEADRRAWAELGTMTLETLSVKGPVDEPAMRARLEESSDRLMRCYGRRLAIDRSLRGDASLGFTVDLHGYAVDRTVRRGSVADPSLLRCLLSELQRTRYPKPKGSLATVELTFAFRSREP